MNRPQPKFLRGLTRYGLRFIGIATVLLGCAAVASAIPLQSYRQRLHDAQVGLTALMFGENEPIANADAQFEETISAIRASLPAEQTVEWEGGSTRVDNSWLHTALVQLAAVKGNEQLRNDQIVVITERLTALDAQIEQIEKAQTADGLSRDEAKARLAEILRRKEFAHQQAEAGAFEKIIQWIGKRIVELLDKLLPRPKPLSAGPSAFVGFIARIVIIVLAVGLIGFVIWKLAPRLLRGGRRKKVKKPEARVVLGETLDPDQTAEDILAEAEKLAREGNIRGAIRKAYIALLCELGDRKVVGLAQHKTNRDYLRDVHERRALFDDMRQLTDSFEYHWYGSAPATGEDWTTFRRGYRQALSHG